MSLTDMLVDLFNRKSLTPEMAMYLEAAVKARLNFLIGGASQSGKTTILSVLDALIGHHPDSSVPETVIARLGALSDQNGRKGLPSKPKATGPYVVTECHGRESPLILEWMISRAGSAMTAVTSSSPLDALQQFQAMVLQQGSYPPGRSIAQDIAHSFSVIVQMQRLPNGSQKVTSIAELTGCLDNQFVVQDVFTYDPPTSPHNGQFRATGFQSTLLARMEAAGIGLPSNMFKARVLLKD